MLKQNQLRQSYVKLSYHIYMCLVLWAEEIAQLVHIIGLNKLLAIRNHVC